MIRPVSSDDTPALLHLAMETGFFKPLEIDTLQELLKDYHNLYSTCDHHCHALEREGRIQGFVYFAPNEMTDRTWYVYWIAVARLVQGQGSGTTLLHHAEATIRARQGRLVFIETSSQPTYEPTRRFYLKHRYEVAGQLRDFYAEGDDMVIFRKRLG